jgi:hypothetical protein
MLLAEQLVEPFNFYFGGAVRQGIRHGSELYGLTHEFNLRTRSKAYQTACELMNQTTAVIMTASETRYAIWVNLRSPLYSNLVLTRVDSVEVLTHLPTQRQDRNLILASC